MYGSAQFDRGPTPAAIAGMYAANWAVPHWYLDGTVGSDANNGTTALTPLRTGAELLRRLGPYAIWPQSVTVHVLANGMVDALILRGLMAVAGSQLDVVGTPTQIFDAGTIATYSGVDHVNATAPQLSCTGVADWSTYQWRRLRITSSSGNAAGSVAFVAVANPTSPANPGGIGIQYARVQRFCAPDLVSTVATITKTLPVIGDHVVIESLPRVPQLTIECDGPLSLQNPPQWQQRQYSIQSIDCPVIVRRSPADDYIFRGVVWGCMVSFQQNSADGRASQGKRYTAGSLVYNAGTATSFALAYGYYEACLFGSTATYVFVFANAVVNTLYCVSQNSRFAVGGNCSLDNHQFFDIVGATNAVFSVSAFGAIISTSTISGYGNQGFGLALNNQISLKVFGTVNLNAALGEVRLSGAPATTLTNLQSYPTSDFARNGVTPAMIAGTTTVTVPWYDNAIQRVTVSHLAFAGTPGILSVQQISTTQFTITSSSAIDTSTVNWAISPLGRNIFISTT